MERLERHALEGKAFAPSVNDGRLSAHIAVSFGENQKVLAEAVVERSGRFDLCRDELSAGILHKIDFHALGITIEVEIRPGTVVVGAFHRLKNDEVLEKSAAKRIAVQLFGVVDSRECTGEARIVEIEFGRFCEPLAPVLVPRRQEEADVRRMEDGKPFHYGLRGYAGVVGDGRNVENRADAPDEYPKKVREEQRVLDFEKLVNVAFHVGVDVTVKKSLAPYATGKKTRVAACQNGRKHIVLWQKSVRFPKAERKQCEDSTPSGERLADILHQENVTGAGENEKSVDAFVIYYPLYVGEQVGHTLDFVENRSIGEFCKEFPWVAFGKSVYVGIFKRPIGFVGEERLGKRRLARLPRADNGYDRKLRRCLLDRCRNLSFYVHGGYYSTHWNLVQYGKWTSRIAPVTGDERMRK